MPAPIAQWNPARSVWETNETLICGHSDVWSETWPSSGMWADGQVYALPTSAPLTDGSESSSSPGLLPTPEAYQGSRGGSQPPSKRRAGGHSVALQDVVEHTLPTPQARDWKGVGPADHQRKDPGLPTVVETLLPTPKATDGTKGGPNQRGSSGDLTLPSAAVQLLPTPTAMDSVGSRGHRPDGTRYGPTSGTTLTDAVLLPTPLASDAGPRGGTTGFGLRHWSRSLGATTSPPSDDGNESSVA